VSPYTITQDNAASVQIALDQRILDSSAKIGVHTTKSEETAFVSGSEIKSYLESTGVKLTVVDFSLASVYVTHLQDVENKCTPWAISDSYLFRQAVVRAVPNKPAIKQAKEKTIEGAELVGITIRKEDDFSAWYQQVLTKGDMLDYYDISGCYILKVLIHAPECSTHG